ncbi:MAG TPA: DUF3592 domain-containing protein [Mycobacteriales bacterium]|nr:DUF3592 domain-containing protein [Mycobacteriales bacterium]
MSAGTRLSSALDGIGPYAGIAAALSIFALLSLLLTLQSRNDMLLWTGGHTIGVERGGVVRYQVDGEAYTHVPTSSPPEGARVDVYYDRSDPFTARLDSLPARLADVGMTGVPLVLGAGVLALGIRRRMRIRASDTAAGSFGTGLDPDFVRRQLAERRRPPT